MTQRTATRLRAYAAAATTVIAAVILIAAAGLENLAQPTRPQVDISHLPGPAPMAAAAPTPIGPLGPVVALSTDTWVQWAHIDHTTGTISGSAGAETERNTTESVVKAWLAADYLTRNPKPSKTATAQITRMIRDSNDTDAQAIYTALGRDESIRRMIAVCGLTNTAIVDGWWSQTAITAADAVRLGRCLADGRAAGPQWTPWLLGEMRSIRGEGAFGITRGLIAAHAAEVAYKNGWTLHSGTGIRAVNCLAIGDGWSLAVLQRYPQQLGLEHGALICQSVATQLVMILTPKVYGT